MNRIAVAELTSEAFAPFGEVGAPHVDSGRAPLDVALYLSRGMPRFSIMRLAQRGLVFEVMAPRDRLTQCLSAVDGEPSLIAVAPSSAQPGTIDIGAFRILSARSIKLGLGTWHAGPYFAGPPHDFYNLETVHPNIGDYTVWQLHEPVELAT
jgi:ureidoglycolate hydrolase